MSAPEEEKPYEPKDTIATTIRSSLITGGAGTLIAGVQNTLRKQNVGAMGIFTRSGSTIAVYTAVGGTFAFVQSASANLREKDDAWNHAIGGFFAGSVIGLPIRTMPAVLGYGAVTAIILGTFEFTGGLLGRYAKDSHEDAFAEKEELRKRYRRPIQETLAELGEGRGIKGPGYEERRRERIKQKYGIDVP